MSPRPFIATLPIQRLTLSGAKVDCWLTLQVPAARRSSYQRGSSWPELLTVSFVTKVS